MTTHNRLQLYPMLRIAVALIVGILVGKAAFSTIAPLPFLILTAVSLIAYFVLRRFPTGQTATLLAAFCFFGAFIMTDKMERMEIKLPQNPVVYHAVLLSEPVVHGKVIQTDMLITDGDKPLKVRASILRDTITNCWQRLHAGDGIIATSQLTEPQNFAKSTFDYATWLKYHGFDAETFIFYSDWRKASVDISNLSYSDRLIIGARKLRQRLLTKFHDMGADDKSYALLAAMALGDKSALTKDLKDDYSVSGASHVLALSGLHLGIIYAVLSMLAFGFRQKWLSQLIIMLAVWSYVVIVGMSPSVVRSAVMLTIFSLVTILNRQTLSVNSLAVAAIAMLILNPLNLYDIGFEMSFAAVLSIALFLPILYSPKQPEHWYLRALKWLWSIVAMSIAAQLGTAPLIIYYFGRFSCYFILTNLIVVPLTTVLLYGAVAVAATYWLPAAAAWIADKVTTCADIMNAAVHWIATLPGASIDNISWSKAQAAAAYMFLFALYLLVKFVRKRYKALSQSV